MRKKDHQPKKSTERGWYRVDSVLDHRITRKENSATIELKVKWNGYAEPTWESFSGFVKDAAPLVERYLAKKGLLENLSELVELKKLRDEHLARFEPVTFNGIKSSSKGKYEV